MDFLVSVGVQETLFHFDLSNFIIQVVLLLFVELEVSYFLDQVPFVWALILLSFEKFYLLAG